MDIKQAVEDYITAHEIENFSAATIANTRKNLQYFVEWLQSAHNLTDTDDLQLAHLRGWISHLQKTPARHGGKRSDSSVHTFRELEQFRDLGVTHFMFRMPDLATVEHFVAAVVPHFNSIG